ncbi:MAG: type I methionyl aminopeptidase [Tissierellia bacterium]|nr:type I methionyl aminopeptidase [Tissierellia bacterium]
MIHIKSMKEIEVMKKAGAITAYAHKIARQMIRPGISTSELDLAIQQAIVQHGATPSFLDYRGYPASSCISLNDTIIHGIPSKNEILQEGDIVSIDIGACFDGYHGDAARTYGVGQIDPQHQKLIDVTRQSFFEGLAHVREGHRLGDVSQTIQRYVEQNQMSVVRMFTGHGIGKELHEDPAVPNYGTAGRGPKLEPNMVLAIEPMVNLGSHHVKVLDDEWTVKTTDGSLSAHYEHTVWISPDGPVLLTAGDEDE